MNGEYVKDLLQEQIDKFYEENYCSVLEGWANTGMLYASNQNNTGGGVASTVISTSGSTGNNQSWSGQLTLGGSTANFPAINKQYSQYSSNTITPSYTVMDLDRTDASPISVFVDGGLLTIGMLGSDVECAYVGKQLIFSPNIIYAWKGSIRIAIEYYDEIRHYVVQETTQSGLFKGTNTNVLNTVLMSAINKLPPK